MAFASIGIVLESLCLESLESKININEVIKEASMIAIRCKELSDELYQQGYALPAVEFICVASRLKRISDLTKSQKEDFEMYEKLRNKIVID